MPEAAERRLSPAPSHVGDGFDALLAHLASPGAFPSWSGAATRHETHMSWVFFAGDAVYKLKKPIRLPYLDFTTVAKRRAACEAEHRLNQRLAPGVYLGVVPIVRHEADLRIGGTGEPVDWLVLMRRLDLSRTLETQLRARVALAETDALARRLAGFYRRTPRRHPAPQRHLAAWRALLALNRSVLLTSELAMPAGLVRRVLATQARFIDRYAPLLIERVRTGRIVDAHGDLRPEHIWMGPPILIIDRLEFSAELRSVDWLDELAYLEIETERLGAGQVGERVRRRVCTFLDDRPPETLRLFYASMRAMLRARLSIAHLLEPYPRTPEKWPAQTRAYLEIAVQHASRLDRKLRTPSGP